MFNLKYKKKTGITRRDFIKTVVKAGVFGAVLSSGIPPALGRDKKVLIYGGFGENVGHLSPVIRHDTAAGLVIRNIFDNLVMPNYETRDIEPILAESWKNIDSLTWQIKMREGIKWQKGYGELTAEDLNYTWQFHLDSKSWIISSGLWPIAEMKVISKYVMEVKLKQPFAAFPAVTMGYGGLLICKKAHKEMGNETYKHNPVGSGPFEFVSRKGNEVFVRKFKEYWRPGEPHLEEIVFRSIPDSHVRLQALEKGELDFISHPDAKDISRAKKNPKLIYSSIPGWNWDYQQFNLKLPEFPYQNKLVRQAISYTLDREAIKSEIYYDEATVTDNQIPYGFLGYRPGSLRYPARGDLKKARELMSKAGGRGYDVEVICSDKDWLRRELELVAAMVSQIGINYKIRNLDMGSFNNLWINDKYQQLLEDITIVSPDPDSTSYWFQHSKGGRASGYNNPDMDSWLDKAREVTDSKEREKLYYKVVDQTLEDCREIFHINVNYVRLWKKGLVGFNPSPQEYVELFSSVKWEG